MFHARVAAIAACSVLSLALASPASADPDPNAPPVDAARPASAAPADAAAAPAPPDGHIPSAPPSTVKTPDGWTLTVSAKDETMMSVPPLTTALSSREYVVGGMFNGSLEASADGADGEARGILEVGYQIGCGIDMSTSQGVTMSGSVGFTPSLGLGGIESVSPLPEFLNPILLAPVAGAIAVGLKPGIISIVPVVKKDFEGAEPWVMISTFHVKIDGCVGESFIRSYATLTRRTDISDAILSWVGVTKKV